MTLLILLRHVYTEKCSKFKRVLLIKLAFKVLKSLAVIVMWKLPKYRDDVITVQLIHQGFKNQKKF